jgi:polyadenylate-binding protein
VQDESSGKYFAFVNFDSHEAAQAACKEMHDKELDGCKLYVDRAQTKAERQSILQRRYEQKRTQMAHQMEGKNVYVKNLAPVVDEEKLKAAFAVRYYSVA